MKNNIFLSLKIKSFIFLASFFCFYLIKPDEKKSEPIIPMVKNPDSEDSTSVQFDGNVCSHNPKMNLFLGRLCSVDTRSEKPKIHVIYPDKCEVSAVLCHINIFNLRPIRSFYANWATKKTETIDFNPTDKSIKNKSFLLGLEYKNGIPMWWKLKCMHDLKDLIFYLKEKFIEFGIEPIKTNSLMITIESCSRSLPILATHKSTSCSILTREEALFLNEYFTIIQDQGTINHMVSINAQMLTILGSINLFDLKPNTENTISSIFNWIYSKIKIKDILLIIFLYELFRMFGGLKNQISQILSNPAMLEAFVNKIADIIEARKGRRSSFFGSGKHAKSFAVSKVRTFSPKQQPILGSPTIPVVATPSNFKAEES